MTSCYTVTAYINAGPDNFSGLKPEHPIAKVGVFEFEFDTDSHLPGPRAAAEAMFAVGNRMEADINGQRWPSDVRSLSVGDLIEVRDGREVTFLACASFGWNDVPEPVNPIIELTDAWRITDRGRS